MRAHNVLCNNYNSRDKPLQLSSCTFCVDVYAYRLYFINVWNVYEWPKTYTWSGTFILKDGRYTFTFISFQFGMLYLKYETKQLHISAVLGSKIPFGIHSQSTRRSREIQKDSQINWQLVGLGEDSWRDGSCRTGVWARIYVHSFPDPTVSLLLKQYRFFIRLDYTTTSLLGLFCRNPTYLWHIENLLSRTLSLVMFGIPRVDHKWRNSKA
jgi:hypothetical protein